MIDTPQTNYGIKCFEVIFDHSKVKTPDPSKKEKEICLGVVFPDGAVHLHNAMNGNIGVDFHHLQEMKEWIEHAGTLFELNGEGIDA